MAVSVSLVIWNHVITFWRHSFYALTAFSLFKKRLCTISRNHFYCLSLESLKFRGDLKTGKYLKRKRYIAISTRNDLPMFTKYTHFLLKKLPASWFLKSFKNTALTILTFPILFCFKIHFYLHFKRNFDLFMWAT